MFGHTSKFKESAKIKISKEMGFEKKGKRTYKEQRRQRQMEGSCRGCEMEDVYLLAVQEVRVFKKNAFEERMKFQISINEGNARGGGKV